MKSESEFLIFYMYQEGYTEEDVYDERALEIVRSSLAFRVEFTAYQLTPLINKVADAIKEIWGKIKAALQPIFEAAEDLQQERPAPIKKSYLQLSEPKSLRQFSHQVDNRKPRHLVRKIIR